MRTFLPLALIALTLCACMETQKKSLTAAVVTPDVRELMKTFPDPHSVTKEFESETTTNYAVRLPDYETSVVVYVYKVPPGMPVEEVVREKLNMSQAAPVRERSAIGEESWLLGETGHLFRQARNVIFVGAAPGIPKAKARSIGVHIARGLQTR